MAIEGYTSHQKRGSENNQEKDTVAEPRTQSFTDVDVADFSEELPPIEIDRNLPALEQAVYIAKLYKRYLYSVTMSKDVDSISLDAVSNFYQVQSEAQMLVDTAFEASKGYQRSSKDYRAVLGYFKGMGVPVTEVSVSSFINLIDKLKTSEAAIYMATCLIFGPALYKLVDYHSQEKTHTRLEESIGALKQGAQSQIANANHLINAHNAGFESLEMQAVESANKKIAEYNEALEKLNPEERKRNERMEYLK